MLPRVAARASDRISRPYTERNCSYRFQSLVTGRGKIPDHRQPPAEPLPSAGESGHWADRQSATWRPQHATGCGAQTSAQWWTHCAGQRIDICRQFLAASLLSNNERQERGSELDVAGAYNGVFLSVKRTGVRRRASVRSGGNFRRMRFQTRVVRRRGSDQAASDPPAHHRD
jgi:hypothetical protein